jgi:hypothetical protein
MVKFKDADHITLWSLILDWAVNAKVRGKKAGNDLGGCDDDCTLIHSPCSRFYLAIASLPQMQSKNKKVHKSLLQLHFVCLRISLHPSPSCRGRGCRSSNSRHCSPPPSGLPSPPTSCCIVAPDLSSAFSSLTFDISASVVFDEFRFARIFLKSFSVGLKR